MAGGRRPGPQGIGEDVVSGGRPLITAYAGYGQAEPIGIKPVGHSGAAPAWQRHRGTRPGDVFVATATRYRLVAAASLSRKGAEEELVPTPDAIALVTGAALTAALGGLTGAALVHEVRQGTVVLLRTRPQSIYSQPGPPAPPEPTAPPKKAAKPVKDGWIEIEVKDDLGNLRTGDAYKLELPDGRVLTGTVGSNGLISLHGIDPGQAKLTLTELDGKAWS